MDDIDGMVDGQAVFAEDDAGFSCDFDHAAI